mmetsp:Transcript_29273/g.62139  ORF Transcript_29273/g.62139 Transcript_29273/m.62139 type:complete len:244 (-) Transcript_29273:417-1148(-)
MGIVERMVLPVVSVIAEEPGSSPSIFSNCAVADLTASVLPVIMYFVAVLGPENDTSLGTPSSSSFSPSFTKAGASAPSSSTSSSFAFANAAMPPSFMLLPPNLSFFLRIIVFVLRCTFLIFPRLRSLDEGVQILTMTASAVVVTAPSLPLLPGAPPCRAGAAPSGAVAFSVDLLSPPLLAAEETSAFSTIVPVGIHRSPATMLSIFTRHFSILSISPSSWMMLGGNVPGRPGCCAAAPGLIIA